MKPVPLNLTRRARRIASGSGAGLLLAGLVAALPLSPLRALRHFGLARSAPAKGAHLMAAPTEIRLTFTAPVNPAKTGIDLLGPDHAPVAMDSVRAVVDSPQVATARITAKLAGGAYTVKWKAVAADGESGTGTFSFMLMAPADGRKP